MATKNTPKQRTRSPRAYLVYKHYWNAGDDLKKPLAIVVAPNPAAAKRTAYRDRVIRRCCYINTVPLSRADRTDRARLEVEYASGLKNRILRYET